MKKYNANNYPYANYHGNSHPTSYSSFPNNESFFWNPMMIGAYVAIILALVVEGIHAFINWLLFIF